MTDKIKANPVTSASVKGAFHYADTLPLHPISRLMYDVNEAVLIERVRQNNKWGPQRHSIGYWLAILGEEFGEVCQAIQQGSVASKETDADDLYTELIHVAAVASAMAEQVKEERKSKTAS